MYTCYPAETVCTHAHIVLIVPLASEQGLKRSEIVNWYLHEIEQDIETEQELLDSKLLVEMVIDRLVKHVRDTDGYNHIVTRLYETCH